MFNTIHSDFKFKVIFYVSFILFFVIKLTSCIRNIHLPFIDEIPVNKLTKYERNIHDWYTFSQIPEGINLTQEGLFNERQYTIYLMRHDSGEVFKNLHSFVRIRQAVIDLNDDDNEGRELNTIELLSMIQWVHIRKKFHEDIVLQQAYNSEKLDYVTQRMPNNPYVNENLLELCQNYMYMNLITFRNAINNFFNQRISSPLSPEQLNMLYTTRYLALLHLNEMNTCRDISWFLGIFDTQPINGESYDSYVFRCLNSGKMPVPQSDLRTIYDLPADFNALLNKEHFKLFIPEYEKKSLIMFLIIESFYVYVQIN